MHRFNNYKILPILITFYLGWNSIQPKYNNISIVNLGIFPIFTSTQFTKAACSCSQNNTIFVFLRPFQSKICETEPAASHPRSLTQTKREPWDLSGACKTLLSICPQALHPAPSPTSRWPGAASQHRARAAKTLQQRSVSRRDERASPQRGAVRQKQENQWGTIC